MLVFNVCAVAWTATYTYILLFFAAAAFVAYVARPRGRGEAEKRLVAGELLPAQVGKDVTERTSQPHLHVRCGGGGRVVIERLNVDGLTQSGAMSLAVTTIGKDVSIELRLSEGYRDDEPMRGARFELDLSGYEWRHVRWDEPESGLWCAFSLHVREGIDFAVELKQ